MSLLQIALVLFSIAFFSVSGQCNTVCPAATPYNTVTRTSDDTYTYVITSTCPPFTNPSWTNPNSACDQTRRYSIPHTPAFARVPIPTGERIELYNNIHYLREDPPPILGAIGVLENGIVVYGVGAPCGGNSQCPGPGSSAPSSYVDAFEAEGFTLDQCGGHPDGRGRYHIHTGNNFTDSAGRRMCALPEDTPGEHSALLGWMFDGFPLYGQYSQGGRMPTQLDSCHGHTHLINGTIQYHYHLPTDFPWMIGCFKGCPIVNNNPMQLNFTNPTYGCPQGVSVDPSPLYEDAAIATPTPSVTPTSTAASTYATFVIVLLLIAITYLI